MTENKSETNPADSKFSELETRIAYIEDTIDTQNQEIVRLANEVRVMKEALQLVYKKVSELEGSGGGDLAPADEPPPPHY